MTPKVFLFFLLWLCGVGAAQTDPGPHALRERNPLFGFFITPYAESVDVTSGWRLDLDAGFSNIFERQINESYFQDLDLEQTTLTFTPRYGWRSLELGADLNLRQRGGGFLDSGIQEFHSIFGLPNDNREDVANGRYSLFLNQVNRGVTSLPKEDVALDDLTLFLKVQLSDEPKFPLALKLSTTVNSSNRDGGDAGDLAVQVFSRRLGSRWSYYGGLGMVFLSPSPLLEPITRDTAVTASATLSRRTPYGFFLSAQLDGGTSYFKGTGLSNLDDPPVNLSVAVSGVGTRLKRWRLYFAEDLTGGGPAVDFTLGFNATF